MGKAISSKLHKMRAEDLKRQVKVHQKKLVLVKKIQMLEFLHLLYNFKIIIA